MTKPLHGRPLRSHEGERSEAAGRDPSAGGSACPVALRAAEESLPLFSPPGTSLCELTARLTKAEQDPGVKAVVILSEGVQIGSAQIED